VVERIGKCRYMRGLGKLIFYGSVKTKDTFLFNRCITGLSDVFLPTWGQRLVPRIDSIRLLLKVTKSRIWMMKIGLSKDAVGPIDSLYLRTEHVVLTSN